MRITLIMVIVSTLTGCQSENKNVSLNQLIEHYNKIEVPKSFSLNYTGTRFVPYQSYDYKNVVGLTANHSIEIDDQKQYLFNRSLTNVAGGFVFDYITAVKDTIAFDYSVNKIWDGNMISSLNAEDTYTNLKKNSKKNLSVYEAKKLLETSRDSLLFAFDPKTLEVTITKNTKEDSSVFTFSTNPVQLKQIKTNDELRVFGKFKTYKNFSYATECSYVENDSTIFKVTISSFREVNEIDPTKFFIPEGYTFEKPIVNKDTVSKIGDNTYIIRNFKANRNVLFTVVNDIITVIGAPSSNEYSKEVLETIEKEFPSGKVKFVYVTHMHSDHIAGLQEYVDRDVTIIADPYTIKGIKDFEEFKETISQFKFKTIKDREIFNDVQFHYPKNGHCKTQGFAYIIKDKLIYQGDFMQVSSNLSIPNILPEATKYFIQRIYEDKLAVKTVIGQHQAGNEIPMEFINKYYDKRQ